MNLMWFRTDLRLHDNTALHFAQKDSDCIALFIISPKQWKFHDDADCKVDFWLRQLQQLCQDLDDLNIPLLIRTCELWEDFTDTIFELCEQHNIQKVHCNQEYGFNEMQRDQAVAKKLSKQDIDFEAHHDRLLFPVGSIKNQSNEYYKVFGAFKKVCYERLDHLQHHLPIYPKPKKQNKLKIASDTVPHSVDGFAPIPQSRQNKWQVGETEAWHRLDTFIDQHINQYHIERDFPAFDSTSQLSTYLNAGLLSIRQCLKAAQINTDGDLLSGNEGVRIWLDELLWREFYSHLLYGFPKLSQHQPFKEETIHIAWRDNDSDLRSWQNGETGFPIIDAAMRQLKHTGWMHNRLRMIVAMFLTKNLLIDWRSGEQWFMQHLIDGDLAANNGGWQWSASTGTDSVPYFRIFNPITQSKKFDPHGEFIRAWLPELAHLDEKAIHEPYKSAKKSSEEIDTLDYPKPIVDLKQSRQRALDAFKNL
ncbi:deoxyribodipyrimidine photo-lyase [Acinetobacter sp. A3.8]|uniref:Deoxyribodipyrimidine photo-lyase n=1 Tax=Acinetobacter sedimenti TaxID=2919922 RepID=A0A9X2B979_9GAMM|nr:deoxyribodipyrimidine photo-lyase [Acinetobacter sedimenti]MCJ8146919.1 deoxyribodipyrimidine photo-lyase [Acinetobacter sedimenti]